MVILLILIFNFKHLPAYLGAMSMWFDKNPENMPAIAVIPNVMSATAQVLSQPAKHTPTRQRAGTKEAAFNFFLN